MQCRKQHLREGDKVLIDNQEGGFRFLPGGKTFSMGVVTRGKHEIVHVTLRQPLPYRKGFEIIRGALSRLARPIQALCGIELRSNKPATMEEFEEFNKGYEEILEEWGLLVDGNGPMTRTNVAPELSPPQEPSIYSFSYTIPTLDERLPSFLLSGVGDIGPEGVIRAGETSEEALSEKVTFVVDTLRERCAEIGAEWDQVTATNIYTPHDIHALRVEKLELTRGPSAAYGLCWHLARPPIKGLEFEMDVRGVETEFFL